VGVVQYLFSIRLHAGDDDRLGTGGQDDVRGLQFLAAALSQLNGNFARTTQLAAAAQHLDFIFLHQEVDAFGQAFTYLTAALEGCPIVQMKILGLNAKFFGLSPQDVGQLCIAQQCFGGDAADIQTDPAHILSFDNGYFFAQLGSTDGTDVPARAGPHHNDIKLFHSLPPGWL
jgi:hypothetical protein